MRTKKPTPTSASTRLHRFQQHTHKALAAATVLLSLLLSAGAAQAQADYSLYGVFDLSYGRFEASGALPANRFNSNSLSASFIGANAKLGLDGGWTPGISLETFLRFQDGKTGRRDSDPKLSRNAFVSLNSDYGFFRLGRLQTFLFDATNRFNAFANSPAFSPALRHIFVSGNLEGVQGDFYWDTAASYQTPNLDGLNISLMAAKGRGTQRGSYLASTAIYSVGLFSTSLSLQRVKIDDGISNPTLENAWQFGATYNFGFARLFGQLTTTQDKGLEVNSNGLTAGVSVPLGDGNVLAQVASTRANGPAVSRQHSSTSLGYVYGYDSLTDFYVVGMNDRVRDQTRGLSFAVGARYKY
jgi:predicted porin